MAGLNGEFGRVAITKQDLNDAIKQVEAQVKPWDANKMTLVKTLQEAERNHGVVMLMLDGSKQVAVKKMPKKWVRPTVEEFEAKYPTSTEKPWVDMGLVRHLKTVGYTYACQFHGMFLSETEAFVVTEFCDTGDLFSWCEHKSVPPAGYQRELMMLPLLAKVVVAVRWLHDLGVAHRDLSLENVLLTGGVGKDASVKLIDFGMATLERVVANEARGKLSYQAPEVHTEAPVDTFMLDEFAVGVVAFAMMAQDYPWQTTRRGMCQLFEFISNYGMTRFFAERRLRSGNGEVLDEVFSPDLIEFVVALTDFDASTRASLGEKCYEDEVSSGKRKSVWDMRLMQEAAAKGLVPRQKRIISL